MPNFTEEELEILANLPKYFDEVDIFIGKKGYDVGVKLAKEALKRVEEGLIDPTKPINAEIFIVPEFDVKNFKLSTRFLLELGSVRGGIICNSIIICSGLYTGGKSLVRSIITTNGLARGFYVLSVLCSGTAVTTGGIAALARTGRVTEIGAGSEACAIALMCLGNQAHAGALMLEGKPVPPHLLRRTFSSRQPTHDNSGLSFVMPSNVNSMQFLERIPFGTIGKFVGIGLSAYAYSRFIIVSYRYGQKLFSKFKTRRHSILYRKQIKFFVRCLVLRTDPSIIYLPVAT